MQKPQLHGAFSKDGNSYAPVYWTGSLSLSVLIDTAAQVMGYLCKACFTILCLTGLVCGI